MAIGMPIVDLATYNSFKQFPTRHSVGRNNCLLVLYLSDGLRLDTEAKAITRSCFEKIASQNEKIGLLEAIPAHNSVHIFICLRSTISVAEAVSIIMKETEDALLQGGTFIRKPIWKEEYGLHSLGEVSDRELENYRRSISTMML